MQVKSIVLEKDLRKISNFSNLFDMILLVDSTQLVLVQQWRLVHHYQSPSSVNEPSNTVTDCQSKLNLAKTI